MFKLLKYYTGTKDVRRNINQKRPKIKWFIINIGIRYISIKYAIEL